MNRFYLLLVAALAVAALPDTVRVLEHGARFHRITCGAMRASSGALVRRAEAESAGYSACRRCLLAPARRVSRFARVTGGR